jgi:hypothetical protein
VDVKALDPSVTLVKRYPLQTTHLASAHLDSPEVKRSRETKGANRLQRLTPISKFSVPPENGVSCSHGELAVNTPLAVLHRRRASFG